MILKYNEILFIYSEQNALQLTFILTFLLNKSM